MSMKFRTVVFLKPYFTKIYLRNISHSKDVTIIPCWDGIYYALMNDVLHDYIRTDAVGENSYF